MKNCLSKGKQFGERQVTRGSQYRCGRVGRGIQPPSTPIAPTINTQTKKGIKNVLFPIFDSWVTDGRMDQRMDGRSDKASHRVACPQLKRYLVGESYRLHLTLNNGNVVTPIKTGEWECYHRLGIFFFQIPFTMLLSPPLNLPLQK